MTCSVSCACRKWLEKQAMEEELIFYILFWIFLPGQGLVVKIFVVSLWYGDKLMHHLMNHTHIESRKKMGVFHALHIAMFNLHLN